jgi:hypothetical protein
VTAREPAHSRFANVGVARLEQIRQDCLRPTAGAQQRTDLRLPSAIALLVLECISNRWDGARIPDLAERPRGLESNIVVIVGERVDETARRILRIELA